MHADSERVTDIEAQWFHATGGRRPVGHEVWGRTGEHERRGWQPPSSSRSIGFILVSIMAVAVAAGGTLFFATPDSRHVREPEPAGTTSVTNAETTAAPAMAEPATPPTMNAPPPVPVPSASSASEPSRDQRPVAVASLPSAPPAAAAPQVKRAEPQARPVRRPIAKTAPTPAPAAEPRDVTTGTTAGTGGSPAPAETSTSDDDLFSTPGGSAAPTVTTPPPQPEIKLKN